MKDDHRYDDIIDLPHHVSKNRKQMSRLDRAAQFSPFAALTGYDAAIRETARLTDRRIQLSDSELEELNERFVLLSGQLDERPEVTLTVFVEDERKDGGRYETKTVRLRRIDTVQRILITEDRDKIAMDDILAIRKDNK